LLYFDATKPSLAEDLNLVDAPLLEVPDESLRPSKASLEALNAEFLA